MKDETGLVAVSTALCLAAKQSALRLEALRAVEWGAAQQVREVWHAACPCCRAVSPGPHEERCRLAKAIAGDVGGE